MQQKVQAAFFTEKSVKKSSLHFVYLIRFWLAQSIFSLGCRLHPTLPPTTYTCRPNCRRTSRSLRHGRCLARLHDVETKAACTCWHNPRAVSCAGIRTANLLRPLPRKLGNTVGFAGNSTVLGAGHMACNAAMSSQGSLHKCGCNCDQFAPITIMPLCCGRFFRRNKVRKPCTLSGNAPKP